MFEDSLVDSGQRLRAGRSRWIVAASLAVQGAVVTAFVALPLLFPAMLPVVVAAPRVAQVVMPKPKVKVEEIEERKPAVATAAIRTPLAQVERVATVRGGGVIARGALPSAGPDEAPSLPAGSGMGTIFSGGPGIGGLGIGDLGGSRVQVVQATPPKPAGPVRISSGVIAGLLLHPITPAYPTIAKAAHVEGTVVLSATIDEHGRITGLQVVSGPEMLRRAAIEAVQVARYQPYLLNGAATEVATTISVVFRMEG